MHRTPRIIPPSGYVPTKPKAPTGPPLAPTTGSALETFTPVSGMYCCINQSGNFVRKADYDALLTRCLILRQALQNAKTLLCDKYEFEAAAELSALLKQDEV